MVELSGILQPIDDGLVIGQVEDDGQKSRDFVARFENAFARFVDAKYAVAVNSATSGLMVSMMALLRRPGDNVVTSPMTFCSTSNAILSAGGIPVFSDINQKTLCIDASNIRTRIDSKSRGVLVVDLYGYPAINGQLRELCEKEDLFLVEDAAQALGSSRAGEAVGSVAKATVFSFFESKQLSLGEGGMITTNDEELAENFRTIRSHGQDKQYHQTTLGYNFRLPSKIAADGLVALKLADNLIRRRTLLARIYHEMLGHLETADVLRNGKDVFCSYYRFPLVVSTRASKAQEIAVRVSKATNVAIGRGYRRLVYQQPFYRSIQSRYWAAKILPFPRYSKLHCPNAEHAVSRIVELPTGPEVSDVKAVEIASAVRKLLTEL